MISVSQAHRIVLDNLLHIDVHEVNILQSSGSVLAESIIAARDYPPFHRVSMDGIGINYESFKNGRKSFNIMGVCPAGTPPLRLTCIESCFEVMTGSVAPEGVDCVIPFERLNIENGIAHIVETSPTIRQGQNIHPRGSDCVQASELLKPPLVLNSTSVAVAASEGVEKIQVLKKPKVAVISSGNELVALHQFPKPWQIRRSNSYAIAAALIALQLADVEIFHLLDDKEDITQKLSSMLITFDALILSGAVSKGKFDFIPAVLAELQVEKLFHHVSQRPGKPFWFGVSPQKKPVFALPGNPVSALTGFRRYVVPSIVKSLGMSPLKRAAALTERFSFKKNLTYFLPVKVHYDGAVLSARPVPVNGSGDFSALALTDGFVELPAEQADFPVGFVADYYPWNEV